MKIKLHDYAHELSSRLIIQVLFNLRNLVSRMSTWKLAAKKTLALKRQESVLSPFSKRETSVAVLFCFALLWFNLLLPHTLGTPEKMVEKNKTNRIVSGSETRSIVRVLMLLL